MGWAELHQRTGGQRFFTYADADACGVARSSVDGRARRERWPTRPHPGVIVSPGPPLSDHERIHAAVVSAGAGAVVGGRSALFLYGLIDRAPSRTQLWVPPPNRARPDAGRIIRRTTLLRPDDVVRVAGLPALRFPWVLRDLAGARSLERLRYLALDGRFTGLLPSGSLAAVIERDRRFRGRGNLAQLHEDLAGDGSDSGFEFTTRDRLDAAGIPPDIGQAQLWTPGRPRRIDLPYGDQKVGVECLGLAYHRTRAQLDADAERANDIASLGSWLILQMTWTMQFGAAWDRFLTRLRLALTSRS